MKALIGIVVVIALLAAGLVVADRVAERVASNLIAQQLTSDLRLSQSPSVDITGFPFLTQAASGEYRQINVSMPSVTALSVTVDDLAATVKDVHAKPFPTSAADIRSASAGTVELGGLIPFASIPLPSGFTATDAGSQLHVVGRFTVFGASVPVTAVEQISLQGSTVTFHPTSIQAEADGMKFDVPSSVAQQLTASVDLAGLPFHVQVTRFAVVPSGLQVAGQARDVSLAAA